MATREYKTGAITDKDAISKFFKIHEEIDATKKTHVIEQAKVHISPIGDINTSTIGIEEYNKKEGLFKRNSKSFKSAIFQRIQTDIAPSDNARNVTIALSREADFDRITLTITTNNYSIEDIAKISSVLQKHFPRFASPENISEYLSEDLLEHYAARERILAKLESLHTDTISRNSEYLLKAQENFDKKLKEKENDLENIKAEIHREYQAKNEALGLKENDLNEKLKEIDDKHNTHARRQIHKELKKALEERNSDFQLSESTTKKRMPSHVLFVVALTFLGFQSLMSIRVVAYSLPEAVESVASSGTTSSLGNSKDLPSADPDQDDLQEKNISSNTTTSKIDAKTISAFFIIKTALASTGFVLMLIYYIKWNDKWSEEHANEEFRLKRLDLDIDRASWIVEMALEWQDVKDSPIPDQLLDRLTGNLFTTDSKLSDSCTKHPNEELLAKVLGATSSLQLEIPGIGQAQLSKKDLKSLKKEN